MAVTLTPETGCGRADITEQAYLWTLRDTSLTLHHRDFKKGLWDTLYTVTNLSYVDMN